MENALSVIVREATVSDYDDFLELYSIVEQLHRENLSWKFKKPKILFEMGDYERIVNDDSVKIYLAYAGELVVGLLIAYIKKNRSIPILKERTYIDVDTICVIENYRKKGIGKMLLSEIESWAKNNDILDIQLNVWEFNENAKNFYLNNGFEPISSIMRKLL